LRYTATGSGAHARKVAPPRLTRFAPMGVFVEIFFCEIIPAAFPLSEATENECS
jgi:hypothetical protein